MPDTKAARLARPTQRTRRAQNALGTVIDERYRLNRVIGRGGYGTVFEAENLRFGGRVALKLLDQCDKSTIRRFNQEARIAGTVLHPNVCHVFDVGWVNDRPYCVMELLHGETLAGRLERKGPMSISAAIDMIIQVLGGLSAAHDAGIVHRDVKPQNVFLVRRQGCAPAIKLLDFGLAKALHPGARKDREGQAATTVPGSVVGTVAYMSPEQLLGEPIDARTDLFSCAVLFFEAVTGELPWRGRTRAEVGMSILREPPIGLRSLQPRAPSTLEAIVERGLAKDRKRRFQTAYEFLRALGTLQRARAGDAVSTVASEGEDELSTTIYVVPAPDSVVADSEQTTKMDLPPDFEPASAPAPDVPRNLTKQTQPMLPRLYSIPPPSSRVPPPSSRRKGPSSR